MPEHLSDETLTDVIDGAADPAVDAHLAGCPACVARLATIRVAIGAVGAAPPPPDPTERDAAVLRAVAAADAPTLRRLPAPAPWMAVAAVVVVLLGAVAIVVAGRDGGSSSDTALSRADESTAGGVGLDAGDLGEQRDAAALHDLLEARLPATGGTAAAGAAKDEAAEAAPAAAPPAAVRQSGAAPSVRCLAEAQSAGSGRLGSLVLTGRLRWRGQPAVVLVFSSPEQAQLSRRAFVMAQRDCQLLVVQSF